MVTCTKRSWNCDERDGEEGRGEAVIFSMMLLFTYSIRHYIIINSNPNRVQICFDSVHKIRITINNCSLLKG